MRRQFVSDKKAEQIIGNKPYRDIQNRRVLFTNVTPAQYERRKAVLDSQVEYSGLIRNGKVMFTGRGRRRAFFAGNEYGNRHGISDCRNEGKGIQR